MTLSDAKFEKKLTCNFKYDMRNLMYFNAGSSESENLCTLICYFCQKYLMFDLTKCRGFMSHNI